MSTFKRMIPACIAGCALLVSPAAPTALAADDEHNIMTDSMRTTIDKAFDAWRDKTITADTAFKVDGATAGAKVSRAIPFTDDPNVIAAASRSKDLAKVMQSPKKLSEIKGPVDKLTPAVAPDGTGVLVLPSGKAVAKQGSIIIEDLQAGLASSDESGDYVSSALPQSLKLLYNVNSSNSGNEIVNAAHIKDSIRSEVMSYKSGKETLPMTPGALNALIPEKAASLVKQFTIPGADHGRLTSVLEAFTTAKDDEQDALDGIKDGLTPLLDSKGNKVTSKKQIAAGQSGDVDHEIEFVAPGEDKMVYINHRVVDGSGRVVSPQGMDAFAVTDASIVAQASTDLGSAKLKDEDKQRIYNTVQATQLHPGKRYQILVNLYKCEGEGKCEEVAAVNREIIPEENTRTEHFSVDIDTSGMDRDNATYEWSTRVYEGTGDVKKMGKSLAEVDDFPESQVLSFSGKRESNNGGRVEEKHADVIDVAQDGAENESSGAKIGSEAPPANIDEIRQNNKVLDSQNEDSGANKGLIIWGSIVGVLAIVGVFMIRRDGGILQRPNKKLGGAPPEDNNDDDDESDLTRDVDTDESGDNDGK